MRLRKLNVDEIKYDETMCSIVKCFLPTDVVVATGNPVYAMCENHWNRYCNNEKVLLGYSTNGK